MPPLEAQSTTRSPSTNLEIAKSLDGPNGGITAPARLKQKTAGVDLATDAGCVPHPWLKRRGCGTRSGAAAVNLTAPPR